MANYYQASPLGAGFSNLATAIAGAPERQAKLSLMEAQMRLAEEQALTQGSHRNLYDAQADDKRLETSGRRRAGEAAAAFYAAPPNSTPPGDTPPPVAPVPGVGNVPGAAPIRLTQPGDAPSSFADSVVGGPTPPAASAPIAVPPPTPSPAKPDVASGVVGAATQYLAQLPPAERSRLVGQIAQGFAEAGGSMPGQFGEFMLGVGGSQNALAPKGQEPFNRTQLSALQTGAKVAAGNTLTGFDADQARLVEKEKMEDATRRRGDDLRHSASIYAANQATARAGKRGGKGDKPLDMVGLKRVKDFFLASGGAKDDPNRQVVSNEQADAMMGRFNELVADGVPAAEAANQVVDEAWQTVDVPGKKARWFWQDDEPNTAQTRFALKTRQKITEDDLAASRGEPPKGTDGKPAPGKPDAAAAPAKTAPVVPKLKTGAVDIDTLRKQANASIAAGKDPKWVADKFKATTGKSL